MDVFRDPTLTVNTEATREVANTIRKQIGVAAFMSLGASGLSLTHRDGNPGLHFLARILPFLKSGKRGTRPRIMLVDVVLNAMDTYDVYVGYLAKNDHGHHWVKHYEAKDIYADQLARLMIALDYDGAEVLNWRYL